MQHMKNGVDTVLAERPNMVVKVSHHRIPHRELTQRHHVQPVQGRRMHQIGGAQWTPAQPSKTPHASPMPPPVMQQMQQCWEPCHDTMGYSAEPEQMALQPSAGCCRRRNVLDELGVSSEAHSVGDLNTFCTQSPMADDWPAQWYGHDCTRKRLPRRMYRKLRYYGVPLMIPIIVVMIGLIYLVRRTVVTISRFRIDGCDAFSNGLDKTHAEFVRNMGSTAPITIVTMGYNEERKHSYACMLREYRSMCDIVAKVIVVWNNGAVEPPSIPPPREGTQCNIPVTIIRSPSNSLNNRFTLVAPHVSTDAVLSIDDDLMVSHSLLVCLLRRWLRDNQRIVGVYARMIRAPHGNYEAALDSYNREYNCMLTGCALYHRRFIMNYIADRAVHAKVDEGMNGEDILFNAVVSNVTHKAPLYVPVSRAFPLKPFNSSSGGLHAETKWEDWLQERSGVGEWALSHFGDGVFRAATEDATCDARDPATESMV